MGARPLRRAARLTDPPRLDRPRLGQLHLGRRRLGALAVPAGLLLTACSPASVLNALAPGRLAAAGIAYGPDPRQRLDVYRPAGPGPFPTMVFIYGGGWARGARGMYGFVGGAFAAHGILTIIPDYRLYPQVRWRGILADCAQAFAWARAHAGRFGGDAAPPALAGHSAGAYNAAMLTLDPGLLGAVGLSPARDVSRAIGLAGPYDFLPLDTERLRRIFGPGPATAVTQPISYVDGRNPPMLLLAGSADRTVRPANTVRLAARIRAAGGPVQERIYPGIDHVEIVGAIGRPLHGLAPTLHHCLDFLRG